MKKLLIATLIFSAIATKSFAKTEGNYVGIDLIGVNADQSYGSGENFDDNAVGFGVNYKYAINFDGFFFAPNIAYERLGTKAINSNGDGVKIDNRYSARIDAGYDFNDDFAAYAGIGAAAVDYKIDWRNTVGASKNDTEMSALYAIGATVRPHKDIILNVEYNFQNIDLDTPLAGVESGTDISAVKIGVAYRF